MNILNTIKYMKCQFIIVSQFKTWVISKDTNRRIVLIYTQLCSMLCVFKFHELMYNFKLSVL